jgi:hypothetical protein
MGIYESAGELVKYYEPLLQQLNVAYNNAAAEQVMRDIKMREGIDQLGGNSFEIHRETELRKLLIDNVRNGNIRAPDIVGWVKNQEAELEKTRGVMKKAFEEIVGVPICLVDEGPEVRNLIVLVQSPRKPRP